jgi:hypothetical protein
MKTFNGVDIYESLKEIVEPSRSCLVVWDVQQGLVNSIFNKDAFLSNHRHGLRFLDEQGWPRPIPGQPGATDDLGQFPRNSRLLLSPAALANKLEHQTTPQEHRMSTQGSISPCVASSQFQLQIRSSHVV